MWNFVTRLVGAATLDARVYEDVEADSAATAQAVVVILLGTVAAGFGARGWNAQPESVFEFSIVAATIALVSWACWALLTFEIGGRLMPERQTKVDVAQLLRTIGFSAAPALFLVVAGFAATTFVFAATAVWMLATMVMAIRQALDYTSTMRAFAVCAIGGFLTLTFVVIIGLVFGPTLGG
jgi:hypothetical protein